MKHFRLRRQGKPIPARLTSAVALTLALAACGGGGSNDSAPATVLKGQVVDGPIKDASVKAFALDSTNAAGASALATATTAVDGSYSLTLPASFSGNVVLTATGGDYCAGSATAQVDASGNCPSGTSKTTLAAALVTLVKATAGTTVSTVHLTPVSTAALPLTASVDATSGVVTGTVSKDDFDTLFGILSGGRSASASPSSELKPLLDQINLLQSSGEGLDLAAVIGNIRSGSAATMVANAAATSSQSSFSILQGGSNDLQPSGALAQDPTLNFTNSAWSVSSLTNSYFQPRKGIDVATLKGIMEDATVTDVPPYAAVNVAVGGDTYKGYRLADVIVRATRFRPRDFNTGAYGVTTAVVAFGAKADGSTGRVAAFSFTELIRSENGEKTIVAFEKNGSPLPASEGALAIIPGNDYDRYLRRVARLKEIHVRNDYVPTSYSVNNTDPAAAAFQVTGQVTSPISVTANAPSTGSSQGYYAVDKVGGRAASAFSTYYFQEYGPRHASYWWGQGIRLTDVLDTAGLKYPGDKGACFVVVNSALNQPALFSCGELYNSRVGRGDGLAGAAGRSRSKGVLLVTDDLRAGGGNNVMMTCWNNLDNCTKNNGGDATAYTSALNTSGNQVNKQMIALVSTEDRLPFQSSGRWFPFTLGEVGRVCQGPTNCIPWIDVGERMQQNIKTMTVYYASGTGNGTAAVAGSGSGSSGSGGGTSGSTCSHDQIMAGQCVKADRSACTHLDYMAGTTCYLP